MSNFTVKQIAEMLNTSEETVRRWIRDGKLTSSISSKKSGNIISSDSFNAFISKTPKYALMKLTSSPTAVSLIVGGMLAGLLALIDIKKSESVSPADIEKYLNKQISSHKKELETKKVEMEKLKKEIESEQLKIDEYKYALEQLDCKLIAAEINKEMSDDIKIFAKK